MARGDHENWGGARPHPEGKKGGRPRTRYNLNLTRGQRELITKYLQWHNARTQPPATEEKAIEQLISHALLDLERKGILDTPPPTHNDGLPF